MKLMLEPFDKVSVLFASGLVTGDDARVLLAGVAKLVEMGRPWVLVDLSRAELDAAAFAALGAGVGELRRRGGGATGLRWIGGPSDICEFESLGVALDELKFKEIRELGIKVELEGHRESLSILLAARESVRAMLGSESVDEAGEQEKAEGRGMGDKESVERIERRYFELNRTLRSVQTQLINRLLDPVFADLPDERPAATGQVARLRAVADPASAAVDPTGAASAPQVNPTGPAMPASSGSSPYDARDLAAQISRLRGEVKELGARASKKFIEGADRAVSLVIENDVLRGRIGEVREVWLRRLAGDARVTEADFEAGFDALIESIETVDSGQPPKKEKGA